MENHELDQIEQFVRDPQIIANFIASGTLIFAIIILRIVVIRGMTQWNFADSELRRRWIVNVKNLFIILGALGLVQIWFAEIKTFAISVVAVAAALVIATKELLMCFLGGVLKAIGRPFSVGDRVEIGQFKGDVIDHSFLTTTLSEVGPDKSMHQFTGRIITVPNSVYLSTPTVNESRTGRYVLHIFRIPVKMSDDWEAAEKNILEAAQAECHRYLEDARKHLTHHGKAQGLEPPTVDPRVNLSIPEPEKIELVVRIPVPEQDRNRIQQAIIRRYLQQRRKREARMEKETR